MGTEPPDNDDIAAILERVAELLQMRQANRYRIRSYRDAAAAVRQADQSLAAIWRREGVDGLQGIYGIGAKLARAVREILETGRLAFLDRLEAEAAPDTPFVRLPGIDGELAARLHDALGVETLEDLEIAAHDGRLEQVADLDAERIRQIREELARLLSRPTRRRAQRRRGGERGPAGDQPPVALLLEIDEEYRRKAEADELTKIAPRRFNPQREKWLPIHRVRRGGWSFTALFSNTARAHELGKTNDWVVLYYKPARDAEEDQCTVVTGSRGRLRGRRIVRGREAECREHYGV